MSIEFLVTSLVVVLLPGTGVIYTLAIGLGLGFRASVAAAFGCTLGIVPAALAALVGLAAIFHTSALAFQVVKYLGVAYLLWMAWQVARDGGALSLQAKGETRARPAWRIALDGTLLNVLNPKLSLFFLAFLPQFADPASPGAGWQMAWLALVFMAMTFVVFVGYGAFAAQVRRHVAGRPGIMAAMRGTFAAAFGLLGLRLLMAER